jgi:hypothetical protein
MKWLPLALTASLPLWLAPMLYLLGLLLGYQEPYDKHRSPHQLDQSANVAVQTTQEQGKNPRS